MDLDQKGLVSMQLVLQRRNILELKLIEKVLDKFVSVTHRKLSTRWIIIIY